VKSYEKNNSKRVKEGELYTSSTPLPIASGTVGLVDAADARVKITKKTIAESCFMRRLDEFEMRRLKIFLIIIKL